MKVEGFLNILLYVRTFLSVRDKVLYRKREKEKSITVDGDLGGKIYQYPRWGKKEKAPKNSSGTHSCAFASAGVMVRLPFVVCRRRRLSSKHIHPLALPLSGSD